MTEKPIMEQDWREVPRSEMLARVTTAVDGARCEAIALEGEDAQYARYVERHLFPFLEAEMQKAREAEREYEEDMRELLSEHGVSEEEARLMMRDDDLWLLEPMFRYGSELDGEKGVRLWEGVVSLTDGLAELATNTIDLTNPAATQLICDAAERAEEAFRRVRERTYGEDARYKS